MADDGKGGKSGWTDRELVYERHLNFKRSSANVDQLVCLLNVVEKSDVTLNFKVRMNPYKL